MDAAPYMTLYFLSAATSFALLCYGARRWKYREVQLFVGLMACTTFWSFCHALSVGSTALADTLWWAQVQYAGIVLLGPMWLLYALAYANRWQWVTPLRFAALLAVPVLSFAAVWTNNAHMLWWPHVMYDTSRAFSSLAVTRGPLFWLHAVVGYGYVLAGLWIVFQTMLVTPPFFRTQARLVVLGAAVPVVGNVLHLLGLRLDMVDDPTPFLFVISGLIFCYATIRYHLLDVMPVAHREMFENMPDGVVVIDTNDRIVTHNAPLPTLLAIAPGDRSGQSFAAVVEHSPLRHMLHDLLAANTGVSNHHATYAAVDGLHGIEVRAQPLATQRGTRSGTLLVLRDTTERVRAEQTLDQRLAELLLINQTAQAINAAVQTDDVLRVITDETLRALHWDRCSIVLLEPESLTLRVLIDHPQHNSRSLEGSSSSLAVFPFLREVLAGGELRVVARNDPAVADTEIEGLMDEFGLQTMLMLPLRQQDRSIGILIISSRTAQQITHDEQRVLLTLSTLISEAIARTSLYEESQRANAIKSVFLATVSHELRTPLTSILGFTEMIGLGVFGSMPEPLQEPLDHIRQSSQRLSRLINDLLDFSRMESGHLNVDLYPVDVAGVVRAVAGLMQPQVHMRALTLELDLPDDLPLVRANGMRLEQVLINLVANAIKFTETGVISVRALHDQQQVRLSVYDTGIGISAEQQNVIFDAFRQIDSQQVRRFGGTGLGLAISKRLMDLMGGSLLVESTPGVGSVFHCWLPVAHESTVVRQAVSPEWSATRV